MHPGILLGAQRVAAAQPGGIESAIDERTQTALVSERHQTTNVSSLPGAAVWSKTPPIGCSPVRM